MRISDQTLPILLPILGLAIVAVVARSAHRSWLAPGPFFALFWLTMTLLSVSFAPSYHLWVGGLWLLLVFVLALLLGADMGQAPRRSRPNTAKEDPGAARQPVPVLSPDVNRGLARFTVGAAILGSLAILFVMNAAGIPVSALMSYDRLARAASDLAWRRYTVGFAEPALTRLCLCGIYLGALVGAALWGLSRQAKHKFLAAVPLLVALVYTSVVAARAAFCFALVLFVSVLLCLEVYKHPKTTKVFTAKRCAVIAVGVLILVGVFVGVQHLRDSRYASATNDDPIAHLRLYFCGSLSSFSLWTKEYFLRADQPTWGVYSAAGLFQLLGVKERDLGLYRDFMELGGGERTNIYTIFRGLIADFTAVGSVIILTVCGFISGRSYQRVREGHICYLPLLTCFYATTICGIATSLFNYNTLTTSIIVFQAFCVSVSTGCVRRGPRSGWRAADAGVTVRARRSGSACTGTKATAGCGALLRGGRVDAKARELNS